MSGAIAPATSTETSQTDKHPFYGILAGGFTPERLKKLLGREGLNLFDFENGQAYPGQSETWSAVYWVLLNEGYIQRGTSARKAEKLIKETFPGAAASKSSITRHPFKFNKDTVAADMPDKNSGDYILISRHF